MTGDIEKKLYGLSWCLTGAGLILALFLRTKGIPQIPCLIYALTGFYCPGCGGTRAFLAAVKGQFLLSLWYHPAVLYGMTLFFAYLATQTFSRILGGRIPALRYRNAYLYGGAALMALHGVRANVCLHLLGIPL